MGSFTPRCDLRALNRSLLLVIGQFGSIAVLLVGGSWMLPSWAWIVFAAGWALFIWSLLSIGRGNFTIMPEPRSGNTLSRRGIYRWLRHPMYAAVIICGSALAFGAPSLVRWVALGVCITVLLLKVRHEEAMLIRTHPDYLERMKGTRRLVPGIW